MQPTQESTFPHRFKKKKDNILMLVQKNPSDPGYLSSWSPSIWIKSSAWNRLDASWSWVAFWRPTRQSTSSMNMMLGAKHLACNGNPISLTRCWKRENISILAMWNRIRTSFSDSPLNFDVSVEEVTLKNVLLHSVATALASNVLPVPGGPTRSTPFHGLRIPC